MRKCHKKSGTARRKVITDGLKDKYWEVRVCALVDLTFLIGLGNDTAWAVEQVTKALQNEDEHVRLIAGFELLATSKAGQSADESLRKFSEPTDMEKTKQEFKTSLAADLQVLSEAQALMEMEMNPRFKEAMAVRQNYLEMSVKYLLK